MFKPYGMGFDRDLFREQKPLVIEKTIICPDCEGDMEERSNCCGASIDSDILICHECKEHAELDVCETCNGTGKVTIEI